MSLYNDVGALKTRKKSSKGFPCLISICVFLLVVCVAREHRTLMERHKHKLGEMPQNEFWRLPEDTKPISYDITLMPYLNKNHFKGSVNITLNVVKTRKDIVLHGEGFVLSDVSLRNERLDSYEILSTESVPEYGMIVVTTKKKILPGMYYLFIKFRRRFSKPTKGLYISKYKSSNGTIRRMATSKFEPTYARQSFPCFDEPNLKAKYKVNLLKPRDSSYTALSNFPVSNITDYDKDNQLVSFEETVSMSTYLLCFIVSDFSHTETSFNNDGKKIPLKVYVSPDNSEKTQFAGEFGKKVMEYYINYFQIPYPLPKLDMVAIPDFSAGAMEQWGLITFKETSLLYTNITHSTSNKQRVATVVAHELAHSWFGNLVTMNWWNDLWLNEGFATYIQYKGAAAIEPTWGILDQLLINLHTVLNVDSKLSSHPIVQTVMTPDEISELFDTVTYKKGASLLRMLEHTVEEKTFQQAVNNYLNLYAYKNAVTEDFLEEVQKLVGSFLDVKELMETFTVQMGYPVVTVTTSGKYYTLTQKRFLLDSQASYNETDSEYRYRWSIPVTYVTNLGKSSSFVLFKYNADSLKITKPKGTKWMKFNHDQIGYYRVNYPKSEWYNLINHYDDLGVADRTHLLEDAFSLAEADLLDYEVPLELTKKLSGEFEYLPWNIAREKLRSILKYLKSSGSDQEAAFKKYVINIVSPAYNKFSWNESVDSTHLEKLARTEIFSLACQVDHEACLSEAQSYFINWLKTRQSLSPDLRNIIYVYGMQKANKSTWDSLLKIYEEETDASEKSKLMVGLTSITDEDILKELLELAKDESLVRSTEYLSVIQLISSNTKGTHLVWDWVRSNWKYLVDRFTLSNRYLGSFIHDITSLFSTQEKLNEMEIFFKENPNAGAGVMTRATALETVKANIRWLSENKEAVENWIRKNVIL